MYCNDLEVMGSVPVSSNLGCIVLSKTYLDQSYYLQQYRHTSIYDLLYNSTEASKYYRTPYQISNFGHVDHSVDVIVTFYEGQSPLLA